MRARHRRAYLLFAAKQTYIPYKSHISLLEKEITRRMVAADLRIDAYCAFY